MTINRCGTTPLTTTFSASSDCNWGGSGSLITYKGGGRWQFNYSAAYPACVLTATSTTVPVDFTFSTPGQEYTGGTLSDPTNPNGVSCMGDCSNPNYPEYVPITVTE